jgi:hypothetical protein
VASNVLPTAYFAVFRLPSARLAFANANTASPVCSTGAGDLSYSAFVSFVYLKTVASSSVFSPRTESVSAAPSTLPPERDTNT